MLLPERLELVEHLLFLRRKRHGLQLLQSGKSARLVRRMRISSRMVPVFCTGSEDDDLGRSCREIVGEPELDPMVLWDVYLQLVRVHDQILPSNSVSRIPHRALSLTLPPYPAID